MRQVSPMTVGGVAILLVVALVGLLYAVRSQAPPAAPTTGPATPTVALSDLCSTPEMPTTGCGSAAPSASATATPASVVGSVYWNHHPQVGVTVEISEMRPPASPGGRVALASGTTSSSGTFSIAYSGSAASIGAFVPAHGPYLEGSRPASLLGARGDLVTDPVDLARAITGLSVHDRGDAYPPGPLTITWDPVPEATAYCVAVYSPSAQNTTPAPRCSAVAHLPGDLVPGPRYTTAALAPDKYTIAVIAITDVVIGDLPPTGISFRVVP